MNRLKQQGMKQDINLYNYSEDTTISIYINYGVEIIIYIPLLYILWCSKELIFK